MPRLFHADAAHAAHARQRRTRPALALEVESEDMYSPSVPHQNEPLPSLMISNNDYPLLTVNLNEPQYALPDAAYPPQLLAYPCSTRALRAARAADGLRRMYRGPPDVSARPVR